MVSGDEVDLRSVWVDGWLVECRSMMLVREGSVVKRSGNNAQGHFSYCM